MELTSSRVAASLGTARRRLVASLATLLRPPTTAVRRRSTCHLSSRECLARRREERRARCRGALR